MPFQSEKQRRYLHANHPEIAKRWERDYASGGRIRYGEGGNGDEGGIVEWFNENIKKIGKAPGTNKSILDMMKQELDWYRMLYQSSKEQSELYNKSFRDTNINDYMQTKHAEMHKFNELYQHELANQPKDSALANGGILDINASEEIISDDGNDIELTAYNAAFDDPNDLSTGVRTLFMKKGGNVRLGPHTATDLLAKKNPDGTRSKYQPPGGGATAHGSGRDVGRGSPQAGTAGSTGWGGPTQTSSPVGDYKGQHDWKFETKPGSGTQVVDIGTEREEVYEMVGGRKLYKSSWGTGADPREKYDTEEEMLNAIYGNTKKGINEKHAYTTGRTKAALELAERTQLAKMKKWGWLKAIPAGIVLAITKNPKLAMKTFSLTKTDMIDIVRHSLPVMKAKKAHIAELTKAKQELLGLVDVNNPNTMKNLDDTNLEDINKQLKELTKPREEEDTKGDGPEVPQVVPIGEEIEEYEGTYAMSPWERIKANQAKRAMLVEKDIIQENPIVDESVTDITLEANSGGLANLFRVKNQ